MYHQRMRRAYIKARNNARVALRTNTGREMMNILSVYCQRDICHAEFSCNRDFVLPLVFLLFVKSLTVYVDSKSY